ncbi:hypothetical protein RchiOBHm_Chr3g0486651 [Rosa chinensis]|uniref:Uncharacterized protein n=1 Tax=Rosa chinensis TaxID=74649 RepID=A0A2P6RFD5_ROSCH|nr:hypothetical protein RchiOBHm_Chr3g0486651 [Rosa chinensis]
MKFSLLSRATLRLQLTLIGGSGATNSLTLGREASHLRSGSEPWIWKGADNSLSPPLLGSDGDWLRRPLNLCLDQFVFLCLEASNGSHLGCNRVSFLVLILWDGDLVMAMLLRSTWVQIRSNGIDRLL